MIRRLVTVAFTCAAFLVLVGNAGAALVAPVENCSASNLSLGGWTQFGPGAGIGVEDRCPFGEGLLIRNYSADYGEYDGWRFGGFGEIKVQSASFDVSGGDTSGGYAYYFSGCDGCDGQVEADLGPRDSSSPDEHFTFPNVVGGEAYIYSKCIDPGGCAGTPDPIHISNLQLSVSDDGPPEVSGTVDDLYPDADGMLGWTNKSSLPVSVNVGDYGFGVANARLDIGGYANVVTLWDFTGSCVQAFPLDYPRICFGPASSTEAISNVSSLQDGIHDVQFSATDIVGNSASSALMRLGLDRVAPAPPSDVALDFTPGWPGQFWTADPSASLHWTPPPYLDEDLDGHPDSPSAIESPLKDQRFSLRRRGTASPQSEDLGLAASEVLRTLPADGRWDFSIRVLDEAGNIGDPETETVGLDRDAPNPPENVEISEPVFGPGLRGSRTATWDSPAPNEELESGVCGYVYRFDASPAANLSLADDHTTVSRKAALPDGLADGENYLHVAASSCAGILSATRDIPFVVDKAPPVIALTGLLEAGLWSPQTQTASLSATDSTSGVARVGYALDGGLVDWTAGAHLELAVPDGRHTVTVYAEDLVGNVASEEHVVRTDTAAPVVTLAPQTADDLTLVRASVSDQSSGLAGLAFEIRRTDGAADPGQQEWSALGGAEPVTRGTTDETTIERRIDDSLLPAGDYELRVAASDVAGNSTTDGSFAVRALHLPLRRSADLSAAVATVKKRCVTASGKHCTSVSGCRRKQRCRSERFVDRDHAKSALVGAWSAKYALVGDALDASGNPLAGVSVVIESAVRDRDPEPLGTATTDQLGRYEFALPAGPTRTITARVAGSTTQQPESASATINVRSEVVFESKQRTVRSGTWRTFKGRVLHPEWLPVGGVEVTIQWKSREGWTAFVDAVSTDAQGRFVVPYKWQPRSRRYAVMLRATAAPIAGWPFARGSSEPVRFNVLAAR